MISQTSSSSFSWEKEYLFFSRGKETLQTFTSSFPFDRFLVLQSQSYPLSLTFASFLLSPVELLSDSLSLLFSFFRELRRVRQTSFRPDALSLLTLVCTSSFQSSALNSALNLFSSWSFEYTSGSPAALHVPPSLPSSLLLHVSPFEVSMIHSCFWGRSKDRTWRKAVSVLFVVWSRSQRVLLFASQSFLHWLSRKE